MPKNLPEEVLMRVDALAAKLGTTVEFLYSTLVADVSKRGLFMAGTLLIFGVSVAITGFVIGRNIMKTSIKKDKDSNRHSKQYEGTYVFGGVILSCGLCAGFIIAISSLGYWSQYFAPNVKAMEILSNLF